VQLVRFTRFTYLFADIVGMIHRAFVYYFGQV